MADSGPMPESRRVIFLRSNPIDPDTRVEKSAGALVDAGYRVSVLGWDRSGKLEETSQLGEVNIIRLGIKAAYGTGLRNLPALLRWQWGCFRWLIQHKGEYDIIHACDFDTLFPALILKLIWNKTVVYDIFDFYADHLRSTPGWIKRLVRSVETNCIRWVDGLILVDDARWEQVGGAKPKKLAVVYNSPKDVSQQLLKENGKSKDSHFTLVYVGLMQVERGIREILEVMSRHPDWRLDLAGFGGDEALIHELAEKMENVRWHGRIAYSRALELSAKADALFATYDPKIPNHRYASPNKVFEAMMLGMPIVVARDTNVDKTVDKHNCGLVVDYGDVDQLEAALINLSESPELRSWLGENARQVYESDYSWGEMESRLFSLYASLSS